MTGANNGGMTSKRIGIRRRIVRFVAEEDLRAICFDYFPDVYDELTASMTKSRIVDLLLDSCRRNGRFSELQTALHQVNPAAFSHDERISPISDRPRQIFGNIANHAHRATELAQSSYSRVKRLPASVTETTDSIELSPGGTSELAFKVMLRNYMPGWIVFALLFLGILVVSLGASSVGFVDQIPAVQTLDAAMIVRGKASPTPLATETNTALERVVGTPQPNQMPDYPELGDYWLRERDEMLMVYVPGGSFQMGSENGGSDEKPQRLVTLDGYWLDQTEVSNAQYGRCVAAGVCRTASLSDITGYKQADFPVVGVSWEDANAYCNWVGAQLPSEAQWEYAARGPAGSTYPWGEEEPSCNVAHFNRCKYGLRSVDEMSEGASWVGALNMSGSVWEWIQDWYAPQYPAQSQLNNPTGAAHGDAKVIRGGAWNSEIGALKSTNRNYEQPENWLDHLGLRCVVNP